MMSSTGTWDRQDPLTAAAELRYSLHEGDELPVIGTALHLQDEEVAHAEAPATCWWYGELDVPYQHRQFTAFGGLGLFAITAAASALGNHISRTNARKLATPQWRNLGHSHVTLTSERTIILLDGEWLPLWHDDILQTAPDSTGHRLYLTLDNGAPYMLEGPWVPYLTVPLSFLLDSVASSPTGRPHPNRK